MIDVSPFRWPILYCSHYIIQLIHHISVTLIVSQLFSNRKDNTINSEKRGVRGQGEKSCEIVIVTSKPM